MTLKCLRKRGISVLHCRSSWCSASKGEGAHKTRRCQYYARRV